MSKKGPVAGTREQNGRYYLIRAIGKKRIWVPLTKVSEGEPAFLRALADAKSAPEVIPDLMANLIADWQREIMPNHAAKTQKDERAQCASILTAFVEFRAVDVTPPDCSDYLRPLKPKPRTFNAHRGMLRELMRYAEERGYRPPGSNPLASIRTMKVKARDRYITDSELRRIKVAAMRGKDELDTRSGPMLCAIIDLAYLTGQRISDLLTLEWSDFGPRGITFEPSKVKDSTGVKLLVRWSPRLRDVERRLRKLRLERRGFCDNVLTKQTGTPYTYWGVSSAWSRACKRAGIEAHFHDIRAKALTDVEKRSGMQAARMLGGHSTEAQTSDYVRNLQAQQVEAAG